MAQSDSGNIVWSAIQETPANVETLRLLCHGRAQLKDQSYVRDPLSAEQIEAKMRCVNCRGVRLQPSMGISKSDRETARVKHHHHRNKPPSTPKPLSTKTHRNERIEGGQGLTQENQSSTKPGEVDPESSTTKPATPKPRCVYHPGQVRYKVRTPSKSSSYPCSPHSSHTS